MCIEQLSYLLRGKWKESFVKCLSNRLPECSYLRLRYCVAGHVPNCLYCSWSISITTIQKFAKVHQHFHHLKGESNPKSFSLNFFPHFLKFMGMHQIREFLNFRVIHVPYIVPKKSGSEPRCRVLSTFPAKQESSNILMCMWP